MRLRRVAAPGRPAWSRVMGTATSSTGVLAVPAATWNGAETAGSPASTTLRSQSPASAVRLSAAAGLATAPSNSGGAAKSIAPLAPLAPLVVGAVAARSSSALVCGRLEKRSRRAIAASGGSSTSKTSKSLARLRTWDHSVAPTASASRPPRARAKVGRAWLASDSVSKRPAKCRSSAAAVRPAEVLSRASAVASASLWAPK